MSNVVNYLQELLQTVNYEIVTLENMIIDDGKSGVNDPNNEFAFYAEEVNIIKEYSQKSMESMERIQSNEEHAKYILSKLTDYGDLMKRIDRLTSALDELEYKV
jgi:hypothetical protein